MEHNDVVEARLGFSPQILRRLGEELIPHADQGLIELVRNAYDADAGLCRITLSQVAQPGGTITVYDDGVGMTVDAISGAWLLLGRSPKSKSQRTAKSRVPAGDKGLGRLAALRLGAVATIASRPATEPGIEYRLSIPWKAFDEVDSVGQVALQISRHATKEKQGTTITVAGLRQAFTRADIERLARAMLLLADPFQSADGFETILVASEYADLEAIVRGAYFEEVDYRIVATLDASGHATATVTDRAGKVLHSANHTDIVAAGRPNAENERGMRKRSGITWTEERLFDVLPLETAYASPPATFELWAYKLSGSSFASKLNSITEVRRWLQRVGGVHVYHHALRVPPYGDQGHDWLDMNLRRVRSPEERPSTNNSVGRVVINDTQGRLMQKTDRTGFVESTEFTELRRFATDVLDWVGLVRLREAEVRRKARREKAQSDKAESEVDAKTVLAVVRANPNASGAFLRYRDAIERQLESLREDVLLYRTLATVGTTTATFAHESLKPAQRISSFVDIARDIAREDFGPVVESALKESFDSIDEAAKAIAAWSAMPLALLERKKRQRSEVRISEAVESVRKALEPFMKQASIELLIEVNDSHLLVNAAPASVEAVLANLVVNSINALIELDAPARVVRVRVHATDDGYANLIVSDSGLGIVGIELEEIWLPGRTTRHGGTGLGLTIAKDAVSDLGGSITAVANGSDGGAEFTVRLPHLGYEETD